MGLCQQIVADEPKTSLLLRPQEQTAGLSTATMVVNNGQLTLVHCCRPHVIAADRDVTTNNRGRD